MKQLVLELVASWEIYIFFSSLVLASYLCEEKKGEKATSVMVF
jgi:hypothetical protein